MYMDIYNDKDITIDMDKDKNIDTGTDTALTWLSDMDIHVAEYFR